MIVNRSVLREQDVDFINALLRRKPKVIALRVIALLLGLFFLFAAYLDLLSLVKWKTGTVSDALLLAVLCVLAYLLLSRAILIKRFSRRSSLKYKSLFAPRTYTVSGDGIAVHHAFEGTETDRRFPFEHADCFFETADAVYLRFHDEKKAMIYMCLQDSGYQEGSRAELLALLNEKGIERRSCK